MINTLLAIVALMFVAAIGYTADYFFGWNLEKSDVQFVLIMAIALRVIKIELDIEDLK